MVQNLSHLPELEIEEPPRFCILAFVDFAYGACGDRPFKSAAFTMKW
jgi:hypothetical protein